MANGYIGKVSHSGVQKVTAPNPVSYTHLDVYKRQQLGH